MALRSFATMARRATQHVRVVLPRAHFVNSLTLPRSCRRHMSEVPKKPQFYRRPLPDTCISFSSTQGKEFFKEALSEGTMETYFPLAEQVRERPPQDWAARAVRAQPSLTGSLWGVQFLTQDEPAFCGLTSLAMILNALAVDPGRYVCLSYGTPWLPPALVTASPACDQPAVVATVTCAACGRVPGGGTRRVSSTAVSRLKSSRARALICLHF